MNMSKKIFNFFLIFIFFFCFSNKVYAVNCADLQEQINAYNSYKSELSNLDCSDTSSLTMVNNCNNYNMQKNMVVSDLMRINEKGYKCDSLKSQIDTIINENKENCGKVFGVELDNIVNNIMIMFYIIGPILLIIFGSIDYARAVVASDEKELKKANIRFIKRLTATVLLFIAPIIVNLITSLNISDYSLDNDAYSCNYSRLIYNPKVNLKSVGFKNFGTSLSKNIDKAIKNYVVDGYIIFKQSDSTWGNQKLFDSSSGNTISKAGCALTAVTMQVVNSGAKALTPGDFNKKIQNSNKLHKGSGSMYWDEYTRYITDNKFTCVDNGNSLKGNIIIKAVNYQVIYHKVITQSYKLNMGQKVVAIMWQFLK